MSVRVSPHPHDTFPLYHLNFLPTVSVSSKQRRPDLDLCLFIPKTPSASNSDANITTLFSHSLFLTVSYLAVQFLFFYFPPPYSPPQPCLFSSVSFHLLTGIRFLFSLCVFGRVFVFFPAVFFTCLLMSFFFSSFSFLLNHCFSSFGWLALEWENAEYVGRQADKQGINGIQFKEGNLIYLFFSFFLFFFFRCAYRYHACMLVFLCMRVWAAENCTVLYRTLLHSVRFRSFALPHG